MLGVLVQWSAEIVASLVAVTAVYLMVHVIGRPRSAVKVRRGQLVIRAHVQAAVHLSL